MYAVNRWGSSPGENDDCWDGNDYPTLETALADYNGTQPTYAAWVEIDGPGIYRKRKNPDYAPPRLDDGWRKEMQREAGMLHGVQGWNDWEGC